MEVDMFGHRLFGTFGPNQHKSVKSHKKAHNVNMLKFGMSFLPMSSNVTSNAASGCVVKISMLRLNIGSGMLRLSSCMQHA